MSKKILYAVITVFFFCAIATPLMALEIDEEEIRSVAPDAVEFVNYTGPHTVIDSLQQIKNIGSSLGSVIARNPGQSGTAGTNSRYYVVHAVDPTVTNGFDADIMFIGKDATVDHIRNLRHIIASYLVSAYGYSEADASTLAVFVTVYNAVYRGNLEKFNSTYKPVVVKYLTAEHAGLALNYQDWPGKSQIVIPLTDPVNGGLSTVDTSVISDTQVVESMREEDDKSVDVRKELVDIKEREADIASEKAAEAQKQATEETAKQKQEEQKLAEAKQEAEEARKVADENPNDRAAQQEAQKKEEAVARQEEVTQAQTQVAEEKRQEAAEQQAIADQKREEARTDRAQIAKDQQQLIKDGIQSDADGVYGLEIIDNEFSRMVKLNKTNGVVMQESPVTVIRGRTLLPADENYMAIAGKTGGNAAVKVVLLDTQYMEIISESTEYASEQSVLVQDGNDYYAVIQDSNGWVLGKYNSQLKLLLKSKISVHPATAVIMTEAGICITDPNGIARLLNKSDLSEISKDSPATYIVEK
ncbi:MAG: hypothetical protein J6B81_02660 [Spirochaetaceae bacterium]|nr:hypothetical protein [Spirochaetaceae bacterium]